MRFLRTTIMFVLCTAVVESAFSSCPNYHRIYGSIDLKTKTWKTVSITKDKEEICLRIPEVANANLELTFKKNNQIFSHRIFRSLIGFYDYPAQDGNFAGGKTPLKSLEINAFVPDWYKGSEFSITDVQSGKKILETKL